MIVGLRERKKAQTRRRIASTARRLFGERGFDGVTVAEIARASEVAEATLFNYFPTKEALLYSGLEEFGARLVTAVAQRAPGVTALAAFRSSLLAGAGTLDRIAAGDREALERLRAIARIISASSHLRGREQQVLAATAAQLAVQLGSGHDTGETDSAGDPVADAVAKALTGVHAALLEYSRRRLLAEGDDDRPERIAADVRGYGERAFALLEHGLGTAYPARP